MSRYSYTCGIAITPYFALPFNYPSSIQLPYIHCTQYTVQCTQYIVYGTLYNVQCTMYNVQCTLYGAHCTPYTLDSSHFDNITDDQYNYVIITTLCTLYTVHCTLYSVHCTLYILYSLSIRLHRHTVLYSLSVQLKQLWHTLIIMYSV